ncbi:MAG: hypothetical protein ACI4A5_10750 [Hominilimicola sp.]
MTFSASGKGTDQTLNINSLRDTYLTEQTTNGYTTGYTLQTQSLLNKMKELGIYKLDIKTELKFDSSADEKKTYTKTLTLIRKEFMLGNASVITTPYTPFKDNNYFNSNYDTVKIEVPVVDKDNYTAETIAASLAGRVKTDDIKLYYSTVEDGMYVNPSSVSASGKKLVLEFPVPTGYSNDDGVGMTLKMTNLTAIDGETYTCNDYTDIFDSKYKIDTKGTEFTLKDENGETISNFDTYEQSHKFTLGSTKTPYVGNNESFFSYKLYTTSAKTNEVKLSSKYTSGTSMAPYTGNTVYEISPENKVEGNFFLEISATDFAGNNTTLPVDTVKIDQIAPRASYTKKEVTAGTTKRLEYTFNLDDISGTGKLYYCIVKDGDSVPAVDTSAPEHSGTVDTTIGKWAFISQTNADAQTVVLSLANGEVFNGTLYYYTTDAAGNDSRNESASGKKKGLNYVDSSLNNENLDCKINIDNVTPGLPEYNISFETASVNVIKYKWKSSSTATAEMTYKGENVGRKKQKKSDGSETILDGEYTLEYTVTNPATGNMKTYTRDFVFDNSAPEVTVTVKEQDISDMQGISIYVKDISSIKTLEYKLVNPDNSDVDGVETISIPAGLPEMSTEITVAPEKTGAYRVWVRAVDANGVETVKYTDIFSIRNTAPSVELGAGPMIPSTNIVASSDYYIVVDVTEKVQNARSFRDDQVLKYRISEDGINYSDWINGGTLEANNTDQLALRVEDRSSAAFYDGENKIFVQAVCVSADDQMANISPEMIGSASMDIIYDMEPPQYNLEFDNLEKTADSVFGTITVKDNYTAPEDIEVSSVGGDGGGVIIGDTPEIFGNEAIYSVEITRNVDYEDAIKVQDSHNTVKVPVKIECIDREAPVVEFFKDYSYTKYRGDRLDCTMSFSVDEALEDKTKFALLKGDYEIGTTPAPGTSDSGTIGGPIVITPDDISDELFEEENPAIQVVSSSQETLYENGETRTNYTVDIRGAEEGNYVLVAYVEDALGNATKCLVGGAFYVKDAAAAVSKTEVHDAYAGTPVKVGTKALVDIEFNVPVYLLPQSNIPDRSDYASEAAYTEAVGEIALSKANGYSQYQTIVVDGYDDYTIYFVDECKRVYAGTVSVTADEVTFNADFEPKVTLYETIDENVLTPSLWEKIDSIDVFDETKRYFITIESNDTYSQTFSSGYADGFYFMSTLSEGSSGLYTKAVYEVCKPYDNTNDLALYYTMQTTIPATSETVETSNVYELHIKDVTPPEINVEQYQLSPTAPVDVMFTFYDPETATNPDAGLNDNSEESGEKHTEAELAAMAGISNVEVTRILSPDESIDYSNLEYTSLGARDSYPITFENNGGIVIRVTNTLGLVSTQEIWVDSIFNDPIAEDEDYAVKYYYKDSEDNLQSVEDGKYYKNVIAKIEPTVDGEDRGLYVSNNPGGFEKELTEYTNKFTFKLKDKYGYTYEQAVSFDRFDSSGPAITYDAGTGAKTNQPVPITVTASDVSGIGGVTITQRNGGTLQLTRDESAAENPTAIYTGEISASGIYTINAVDNLGNTSAKNFFVSNIDTTLPEISKTVYTTTEMTNQNVGVKLYYTKSGVKLTSVEPVAGTALQKGDVIVDYSNSMLRFVENGTVDVTFVDEYGNEGTYSVTVDNINREAPTLEAVAEVSEDLLSVKVTFKQQTNEQSVPIDTVRELSDIHILYYGISETADKAEFEFVENGKYTFLAFDNIGNTQVIEVTIDGIDTVAPEITQVSWIYDYYDETGVLKSAIGNVTPDGEAGYNVVDDINKPTNQNVTVTVTTDKDTVFVGSGSKDYSTTHSMEYDENGWFNFYLERQNKLMAQYGVGIYLIDKTPPVIEGVDDLIFYENPNAGTAYDKSMLTDYKAYDMKGTVKTDLTSKVEVDYGDFNPDNLSANRFDRTHPYEIVYTVKDAVGNETQKKRTVTLVGMFDTIMLVNGQFPDSGNRIEVESDTVELTLQNFGGKAYARYAKGFYTIGEMKNKGTVIQQDGEKFVVNGLTEGWYTFYVQTDLRDYFCVNVYVINSK